MSLRVPSTLEKSTLVKQQILLIKDLQIHEIIKNHGSKFRENIRRVNLHSLPENDPHFNEFMKSLVHIKSSRWHNGNGKRSYFAMAKYFTEKIRVKTDYETVRLSNLSSIENGRARENRAYIGTKRVHGEGTKLSFEKEWRAKKIILYQNVNFVERNQYGLNKDQQCIPLNNIKRILDLFVNLFFTP